MKHSSILLLFAALTAVPRVLSAQDGRNQTVVVTNKYDFDSSSREKTRIEMALPDSLTVFEKSFSYSVFDKPYAGAYDFHPYNLNIKPVSSPVGSRKFWMNAGIGYGLYPEFDLVYEPFRGPRASFGIYARHRSFAGDYRKIEVTDGLLTQLRNAEGKRQYWGGWNYDLDNEGGLNFCYDWNRTALSFNVGYKGLQQRDWFSARSFDKASADLKIYSKRQSSKVFNYAFYMSYLFGRDYVNSTMGKAEQYEHDMKFGFSFVANMKKKGHFALDAGADVALFANAMSHTAYVVEFLPQYVWEQGGWFVKAGVRIDIPATANNVAENPENKGEGAARSQYAYPEFMLSYEFRKIPLNVYLSVTGGERLRSYSAIVDDFRHFSLFSGHSAASEGGSLEFSHPLLKNEVERVNAEFGLRGSIRSVFSYNLSVSYAEKGSLALEAIEYAKLPLKAGGASEDL
ncbi:MAG: hypothetical protein ACI4TM_09935 [Candidatus Cryptobacteroides sp.]